MTELSAVTDSVGAILRSPARIAKFGPRRFAARALNRIFQVTFGSALVAGVFGGALVALSPTGLVDEAVARVLPIAPTAVVSEQVAWVAMPTTPFLEAAREADGSVSPRGLLTSWRKAGLNSEDAQTVIILVSHLRPVLMSRDDDVLRTQLQAEGLKAAKQLQIQHPGVWQRLKTGQIATDLPMGFDVGWEALMSDLESQMVHDSNRNALPDAISLDEKAARFQAVHPGLLESHPLTQTAFGPNGRFDTFKILNTWKAQGLSPHVAYDAFAMLHDALEDRTDLPLYNQKKLDQSSANTLAELRLFLENSENVQTINAEETAFSDELWAKLREETLSEQTEQARQMPSGPPMNMAQARKALEAAVSETGLRAVALSFWQWRSPEAVMNTAYQLTQANAELSKTTGLTGQVLGLGGRVELSFGNPLSQQGAQGAFLMDPSGRMQMMSDWTSLGHEWYHAFDHAVGRAALTHPGLRPMSESLQALRVSENHLVKASFEALGQALDGGSPQWLVDRKATKSPYWVSPREVGAFAFGALLNADGAIVLADPPDTTTLLLEPYRAPSEKETEAQRKAFRTVFRAAQDLHLTQAPAPMAPPVKRFAEWRAERQKPMVLPVYRAPTMR